MFLKKGKKSTTPVKGTDSKHFALTTTTDVQRALDRQKFDKLYEKLRIEKEVLLSRFEEMIRKNDRVTKVKTVLDLIFDVDERILELHKTHASRARTQSDMEEGKAWVSACETRLQNAQAERIASFVNYEKTKSSNAHDVDVNFVSNASDDRDKKENEAKGSTHPGHTGTATEGANGGSTTGGDLSQRQRSSSVVSALNPFDISQTPNSSQNQPFPQLLSGLPPSSSLLGNFNFNLPSSSGFSHVPLNQDDQVSISTTSSVRRKRNEVHEQRLREEVAKHRAEMHHAQQKFKYDLERLQREKDEQIRQLTEQMELSKLEATVQAHTLALEDLDNGGDDDDQNLTNFDLPPVTGLTGSGLVNMSSHVDNWLNTSCTNTSTPIGRRVNFQPQVSTMTTRPIATARLSMPVSQNLNSHVSLPNTTSWVPSGGAIGNVPPTTIPSRSLPKLQLSEFNGDPLDWPEWSGMFIATIGKSGISDDEKMSHLKTLLTGPAKRALSGMGYSGTMFNNAWHTLQRKFGQPHVIVSSQLAKLSNFPQIKAHDNKAFVEFADIVSNFINVLSQFNYTNDLYSTSNLEIAVLKLPVDVQRRWFAHIESPKLRLQLPNLVTFDEWLQQEALVHERLTTTAMKRFEATIRVNEQTGKNTTQKQGRNPNFGATEKPTLNDKIKCPLDGESHKIWNCDSFKKKSVSERYDAVKKHKLCFACLSSNHQIKDCKARPCGINGCQKHHNRLLHIDPKPKSDEVMSTSINSEAKPETKGLLQVVTVRLYGSNKKTLDVKAMCDTGSSKTWIDQSLANSLDLTGERVTIHVAGIHGTSPIESKRVNLKLGATDGKLNIEVKANTHEKIDIGNSVYDVESLRKKYPHLNCIRQKRIELEKVKLILGQDCYELIRPLEYRKGSNATPWAVKLPLGWTISGPLPVCELDHCLNSSVALNSDFQLGEQLRKWLEMESYGTRVTVDNRSIEDRKAHATLDSTVRKVNDRYEVGLLWDDSSHEISNNYVSALGQLRALEARLRRDGKMFEMYEATIKDDLEKGYIKRVDHEELMRTKDKKQWYLPHHAVMHPHKPTKVRRVCNAASKFKGQSLNDSLLTGPDLLNNLIGILFRFREFPIAVSADIEAMFMQVLVPEDDQRCLRFLWRDKDGAIAVYQYTRHIFGARSSPTCAIFALRRCALDNAATFPNASQVVLLCFYMDDLLNSWAMKKDASKTCSDLQKLLAKGGFKLNKWVCNEKGVVPENELKETSKNINPVEETSTVLGLKWNHKEDVLEVCRGLKHDVKEKWTQRQVLSVVSSVFDPMGILSPFIISARLILKEIWQIQGQSWDEFINDELNERFKTWLEALNVMETLKIPRCYCKSDTVISREVHMFADASQDAFCAVGYLRTQLESGEVIVSFLIGKCRVAPKKYQTIPKLELMAALIATRLKDVIVKEHRLKFTRVTFWTDSTTVIQWVRSHNKKHPVFVANRLAEMMDSSTVDQWMHVAGSHNPADVGTRGLNNTDVLEREWLSGPAWLKLPQGEWPQSTFMLMEDEMTFTSEQVECPIDFKRFSSFSKLRNTVVWVLRWRYGAPSNEMTVNELRRAETKLWTLVQQDNFSKEKSFLEKQTSLPTSSNILKLLPFIGFDGLLRAQGRLRKSDLDYDAKHPIILNCSHYVCKLYLEMIHTSYHHEGVEYLRSVVQRRFWIIGLRNALRSVKHRCLECKRVKAAAFEPTMADLPVSRVVPRTHPFTHTGVDYFGPFEVRLLRRTMKRWVCLFTCLTTRAVHLEVVPSLDTDSCMTAVRRFIARRGQPETIISDNGTNFVGARNQFEELKKSWNKSLTVNEMVLKGIQWTFIPPGAPHFGGAWERIVRSCKKAMYHVLGNQVLTDEILLTVITLVEQILNNRPLTSNSSDPGDLEPLTPNHFLIGRASTEFPGCMSTGSRAVNLKRAFRASEQFVQSVWDRWMGEYLPQLQSRQKWTRDKANPSTGDLVWLMGSTTRRGKYPLARIVDLHYGDDGIARSARVRTATGFYDRPLVKLIPIDVDVFKRTDENRAGDVGANPK